MTNGLATVDPRAPVLVGVGTVVQRDRALDAPGLMREAAARAATDAGAPGLLAAAGLVLVPQGTWTDIDPGRTVCPAAHSVVAALGVLQTTLIERACAAILSGQVDVAVVVGGEAKWRARGLEGTAAPGAEYSRRASGDADRGPDEVLAPDGMIVSPEEITARLVSAVSQYALIENARRAADGQSIDDHRLAVASLWERFNRVARTNPDAWNPEPMDAAEIAATTPSNRLLAWPYNKWHNSQWNVDQAGALILCSASAARAFGVATDRWVFPELVAWSDHMVPVSRRAAIHRSPGFALARPLVGEVAHVDLYSCFPIAVRTQALELGLPVDSQLTVTGGMTFAGGPLNNYVLQSTAAMASVLREDAGARGLVTAISGLITKQGVSVWSTSPPADGYRAVDLTAGAATTTAALDAAPVAVVPPGRATIATYTVLPEAHAVVVADTADGRRAIATSEDPEVAGSMMATEWCGRPVHLDGAGGFSPG